METVRQRIIAFLTEGERDAREISQTLGLSEREVYDHLPHVFRSAAARGKNPVILPARCLKCGYVFKDRRRFTPPSRCPRCKQSHLSVPRYHIQ